MVLKFDQEHERVSLGLKQMAPDPWMNVAEKYPETSRVSGKVVSITDYGAFVELEEGIEGLVHVSQMSWARRTRHPSKIVNIGDTIEAVVLSVDKDKKRISLGMKQIEPNPWTTVDERYPVGSEVEGKVRNLTDFGAFIALEEGIDGLIHISDMSWTQRVKHPSEILQLEHRDLGSGSKWSAGSSGASEEVARAQKAGRPLIPVITPARTGGASRALHPPRCGASGCSAKGWSATRSDSQRSCW
jgi:ribosomal protein S1